MKRVRSIRDAATSVAMFVLAAAVGGAACVTKKIEAPSSVVSFDVQLVSIDPFTKAAGCEAAPDAGTTACPRPFAEEAAPVAARFSVEARDVHGRHVSSYNGVALVDVRPGRLAGVGPAGLTVRFTEGRAQVDLSLVNAFGPTRLWVEDCGSGSEAGTFATGVSADEIVFDRPRIDQVNGTLDNTTSPLIPRFTNVCAIAADPRFGLGKDENDELTYVGYSHGRTVNAPPPAMGNYLEIVGCGIEELIERRAAGESCDRGPLVITGVGNEGFYVTDANPASVARGFNHLYVFNFNYPGNLEVGDVITSLRGSPVEFAGSTQFGNPAWKKDPRSGELTLLPRPVYLHPAVYASNLRTYGRNREEMLDLEKLEGAVVCMDNLAPAALLTTCDANESADIERQGCLVDTNAPPPPPCDSGTKTLAPTPPGCDAASMTPQCMPLTADEVTACGLKGYLPENPAEYCCERICYNDVDCSEESSFVGFGQWVAEVNGAYENGETPPVKIALITREANPDFNPFAEGQKQRALPAAERKGYRVIGNLRQVLAARPVWVIIARAPSDIAEGELCPR